jgi:prepilin-type N-terminal cleavage/methylation domain-containing protein
MKRARPNAGFSLIEVMCAVLIMGVALVGLTHGITTALSSTKDSEVQTAVVMLAAGQMETLRVDGILTDGTTEGDFGEDIPLYVWEQTISPGEVDGLHKVAVVVKDAKSGAALYRLETLLFDTDYPATADDAANKQKQRDHDKAKKQDRRRT